MKKRLFVLGFLFVCNFLTFGQARFDLRAFQWKTNNTNNTGNTGSETMILLLFVAIIVMFLILVSAAKGKKGGNLILEEFSFNENEDEFLKIKGRASGFWSCILSLFNKTPATFFTCNKQVLKYELKHGASNIKYNIPLMDITCVSSGMLKSSILLLFLSIIFIIVGLFTIRSTFGGVLIIGIVLLIVYILNRKTIHLGIYIGENKPMITLSMKKGIISSVDINKFESAANMLNKSVLINKN